MTLPRLVDFTLHNGKSAFLVSRGKNMFSTLHTLVHLLTGALGQVSNDVLVNKVCELDVKPSSGMNC